MEVLRSLATWQGLVHGYYSVQWQWRLDWNKYVCLGINREEFCPLDWLQLVVVGTGFSAGLPRNSVVSAVGSISTCIWAFRGIHVNTDS
ncbi:hypothetical protein SUGI_1106270 [Cryptomeria japonica]|nr:hypothetical protein SUGI_1106270 [Cryptomeria japonica]